jgi:hypothetical protein
LPERDGLARFEKTYKGLATVAGVAAAEGWLLSFKTALEAGGDGAADIIADAAADYLEKARALPKRVLLFRYLPEAEGRQRAAAVLAAWTEISIEDAREALTRLPLDPDDPGPPVSTSASIN